MCQQVLSKLRIIQFTKIRLIKRVDPCGQTYRQDEALRTLQTLETRTKTGLCVPRLRDTHVSLSISSLCI